MQRLMERAHKQEVKVRRKAGEQRGYPASLQQEGVRMFPVAKLEVKERSKHWN